ncbi:MAG: hypothetical protein Q9186_007603, partial [Xanthomendoza sp. 1 TL-2023]
IPSTNLLPVEKRLGWNPPRKCNAERKSRESDVRLENGGGWNDAVSSSIIAACCSNGRSAEVFASDGVSVAEGIWVRRGGDSWRDDGWDTTWDGGDEGWEGDAVGDGRVEGWEGDAVGDAFWDGRK